MSSAFLVTILFAITELKAYFSSPQRWRESLSEFNNPDLWRGGFKAAFGFTFWGLLYLIGVEHIATSHAIICASLSGIMIIIAFLVVGMRVMKFEKIGVVFAISGVVVMLMDSSAGKIGETGESTWIFYFIELLSAAIGIIGLQGMSETHQRTSPIRAFFLFFVGGFLIYIPVSTFYFGWSNFALYNPHSMFYFLTDKHTLIYSVLGLAVLGNLLPNIAYSLSLKGYKPQTIGCFILLEPLIG